MHWLLLSAKVCLTCLPAPLTPPRGSRLPSVSPQLLSTGKFYVLQTGCNEKRWSKMKENLTTVVKSFQVEDRSVRLAVQLPMPLEVTGSSGWQLTRFVGEAAEAGVLNMPASGICLHALPIDGVLL